MWVATATMSKNWLLRDSVFSPSGNDSIGRVQPQNCGGNAGIFFIFCLMS